MNPKPLRRFPAAQPINHHCVSYLGIKFHCEHPSSPSMPINGIETAYKDRYTFAPLSQRAVPTQWYTLPLRFITSQEMDSLREMGALDRKVLADGCFVHCLARFNRSTREIEALLVCLEPGERDEEQCRQAWFRAELLGQGAMQ